MISIFSFLLGTIIGSFLNVVVIRTQAGINWKLARSHCRNCNHLLSATDLVPLFSWIFLRGRCRYCSKKISFSYFMVEAITGLLFFLVALKIGTNWPQLLVYWTVVSVLVVVFIYDLRFMLIPVQIVVPTAVIILIANLVLGYKTWLSLLGGLVVTVGFFGIQWILSDGRWIGGGDIKLGLLIGAALGLSGSLTALFLAYVIGALIGLVLVVSKRKTWQTEIPFGTFLSVATVVSLLYGGDITAWYMNLISV